MTKESTSVNASKTNKGLSESWTFMIYFAGDNNLSDDMITAITELKNSASGAWGRSYNKDVNFIFEYDAQHPATKTIRYEITKSGGVSSPLPAPSANSNSEAIQNLIKDASKFGTDKYVLIISAHSDAFRGNTLLVDENPAGITTIYELQKTIKEATQKYLPKEKLDILGFEGCVMNTLEVMYQFRDVAEEWIGSQGSIPNYAWDYRNIVTELVKDVSDVTKTIVDNVCTYHNQYSFNGRSVDISACNLNKLKGFEIELRPLIKLINRQLSYIIPCLIYKKEKFDFMEHRFLRLLLTTHWKSQTFMHNQSIDMKDFFQILSKTIRSEIKELKFNINPINQMYKNDLKKIRNHCDNVVNILSSTDIVKLGATTGLDYRFSNGISLFFPWTVLSYIMTYRNYTNYECKQMIKGAQCMDFSSTESGENWATFLERFLVLTQRPPGKYDDIAKIILDNIQTILWKILILILIPLNIDLIKLRFSKLLNITTKEFTEFLSSNNVSEVQALVKPESEIQFNLLYWTFLRCVKQFESVSNSKLESALEDFFNDPFISNILSQIESKLSIKGGEGDFRDDQIKTRNDLDSLVYYFGRYRNLRVNELNIAPRNFPIVD